MRASVEAYRVFRELASAECSAGAKILKKLGISDRLDFCDEDGVVDGAAWPGAPQFMPVGRIASDQLGLGAAEPRGGHGSRSCSLR